jgi:polysaccharide biosynthesis protein VpsM
MLFHARFSCVIPVGLILAVTLFAQPAFSQGRMVIKPYVETGIQHDSNFHKSETNTKSVNTFNVKPGFEFGYTTDKTLVGVDYNFNVFRYDDRDDYLPGQQKAEDFDYIGHSGRLFFQTQPADRLQLNLDNVFMKTRDPASADANANAVDRFKYNLNRFSPGLTYRFGEKFGFGLKYTNLYTDYSDDGPGQGEDSVENRGTATLLYNLTRKTSFDLDYQYWQRDYDKNTVDYTSSQIMANAYHQFNFLTFGAGIGYHNRDFDKAVPSGDIDQFIWKLSVSGQNPPDAVGIPRTSMYVSFGSNLNDAGTGNTYFTSTRLDVRFTYLLMEKINFILSGYYQNADYETSNRKDDRWLLSLAGDYLINDFFTVGLAGGFEERDSNLAGRDFDNQYVLLKAKFNYDMGSR